MTCVCVFSFVFATLPSNHYSLIPSEGERTVSCLSSFRDKLGPADGPTNVESRQVLRYSDEKKFHRRVLGISKQVGKCVGAGQL